MPNKCGSELSRNPIQGAAITEIEGDAAVFVLPGKYAYQVRTEDGNIVVATFQTHEELLDFIEGTMRSFHDSERPGEGDDPRFAGSPPYPPRGH